MRTLFFLVLVNFICISLFAQPTDLFISEYVEGSSYNKAIELYNGTGTSIDLSEYSLERYTNGASEVSSSMSLEGFLEHGDVFVAAHPSADPLIIGVADATSGSVLGYNGDDAVVLRRGATLVDIIGEIGVDPGSEWGSDLLSTADNTLRRSPSVCSGNPVFSLETEWLGYAKDTFDGLGSHSTECDLNLTPIYDIQYTEDPGGDSPYKDQSDIVTEGIVTAIFSNGYFIEEPAGGPWRGLWISDITNVPAHADLVRLTGTVTENDGRTELSTVTQFQILSSGNTIPNSEIVLTGDVSEEQWESVLVQLNNVTVTGTEASGEWSVDDGSGEVWIGVKGSMSYVPAVADEFVKIVGPVDKSDGTIYVQPRDDGDIQKRLDVTLVFNEIHADPDADLGDANGDGTVDTGDDEFVEIVNVSQDDLDLSGWTLTDATSIRHIFSDGTILGAGKALVLFAGGSPSGDFGGALVQTASSGSLGLNNSGDTVTLNDGSADILSVTYDGTAGDNQSITREPDVTGESFVKHSVADGSNGTLFSPGCYAAGYSLSAKLIHTIQGSGAASPYDGQSNITIEGVVTADFQAATALSGFFLQEEAPQFDAHVSTSEGIFVYDNGFGLDVHVGDMVRVTGTVREYFERTELSELTDMILVRSSIPSDTLALTFPVTAVEELEAYEGMLVKIEDELTVTGNYGLVSFGELDLAAGGRLYAPTNRVNPGEDAINLQMDNNNRRIQLDDGSRVENPETIPYLIGDNMPRLGSTCPVLTGVMDYSFDRYEIHPIETVNFVDANPRPEAPAFVDGLKVVSLNVYNFFNGDGQGGGFPTARGATTFDDFIRQREKLINAMLTIDAVLFGLVELENDGYGSYSAIQDLVNGLNESTAIGTYACIDPGLDQIGDDEITCGIIYRPAILTPLGDMAILDFSVDPLFDATNRPTLAQTFQDTSGEIFTLVVNHFRSKSSPCPGDEDSGDGQGHCNQTRVNAATALVTWLATDPTGSEDEDVLIMGDFNAYNNEDPLAVLKDAGYINLVEQVIGADAYSYTYAGQSGTLDHAFASADLLVQMTGTTLWHINADESAALGYSSDNPPELYDPGPFRCSDHDPVIIGLELEAISVELSLFEATFENNSVSIIWRTENEINIAGFNLLRSGDKNGPYTKINDELIVSLGDSGRGAEYEFTDGSGAPLNYYKLESVSLAGHTDLFGPIEVSVPADVNKRAVPRDFALYANYPNPFNPSTVIRYDLPKPGHVSIQLYDLRGRLLRTLVDGNRDAGFFEIFWDGRAETGEFVAAGLYFYKMRAGDFLGVRKMMLVR